MNKSEESISVEAFDELPIFPLTDSVLFPRLPMALHVFEPRYRRLLNDCMDGHRVFAIATLDPDGEPDELGRPPVMPVVGVGQIRRLVRMPDGRSNLILFGATRAMILEEHTPSADLPYRRVRARPLEDIPAGDPDELAAALRGFRSLCTQVIAQQSEGASMMQEQLNEVDEPSILTDLVAAAIIPDAKDRHEILATCDVLERLQVASGTLGTMLLRSGHSSHPVGGWGAGTGEA